MWCHSERLPEIVWDFIRHWYMIDPVSTLSLAFTAAFIALMVWAGFDLERYKRGKDDDDETP